MIEVTATANPFAEEKDAWNAEIQVGAEFFPRFHIIRTAKNSF